MKPIPYLQNARLGRCPYCGSTETNYKNMNVDRGVIEQPADCLACDKDWIEHYELTEVIERETKT